MRKYLSLLLCLGAMFAVGAPTVADAAGGEEPITIPLPSNELRMGVGFSPKDLSKSEGTPVSLLASGEIAELDGSHPPALRELTMELDDAVEVHTDGIPDCRRRLLGETTETAAALKACRPALIGEGEATVQVAYPENDPIGVPSKLLVFMGGERAGKTTLLIHAYFANPISSSVVIPVIIAKHPSGSFGTRAVAKVPRMADGYGSLTKFNFRIFKSVEVDGARLNPISATCTDGELRVLDVGDFEDGSRLETEVVRACTGRD